MASFSAQLHVAGLVLPVLQGYYGLAQATHQRGRVSAQVRYGPVTLRLDIPHTDQLLTSYWPGPLPRSNAWPPQSSFWLLTVARPSKPCAWRRPTA